MTAKMFSVVFALALAALCSAAVDQQTFDNMVYSAHFSADAYPMPNCSYPEGTKRLQVYTTGAKGFLAVDGQRKWIILSFRGTYDDEDKRRNGMRNLVPYNITGSSSCQDCKVHEGYQEACGLNVDSIVKDIEAAWRSYPGYKVVVTGHSLGGAEVALCGTSIAHVLGPGNVTAYSLAGLAAGNEKFAAYQDAAFPNKSFYRITSLNDTVPQQLKPSQGYYHGGTEYWISKEPDPSPSDVVVCNGQADINCNAGAVKNGTSSPGVTSVRIERSFSQPSRRITLLTGDS
ncbi:alpha/beta-hydrolase [Coniochaeta ligniaria NRRL 30616]|uniref:Alpha/beta-hydrolase n=1 Tax=Coniochaeta ligniaria NRRL 30616 TaxID=1408157 RepID=A0A1J7J1C6_9PEZI|nr:alpha/beta-hydrolase [Coniochaeta ligniaria NRRL 30616]